MILKSVVLVSEILHPLSVAWRGGWGVRLSMYVNVAFFKYKEPPPAGGLLNNQVIVLVFFKSSCGGYKGALFRTVERLSGVCYE
ncbi:MAG: hypothetical protein GX639_05960 [Fibrobacter sp.]|nr:hypothetical protein [Fibrobacter sp.]